MLRTQHRGTAKGRRCTAPRPTPAAQPTAHCLSPSLLPLPPARLSSLPFRSLLTSCTFRPFCCTHDHAWVPPIGREHRGLQLNRVPSSFDIRPMLPSTSTFLSPLLHIALSSPCSSPPHPPDQNHTHHNTPLFPPIHIAFPSSSTASARAVFFVGRTLHSLVVSPVTSSYFQALTSPVSSEP